MTTLPRPPGALVGQLATITDLHIGERRFGLSGTLRDPRPPAFGGEPYPLRCARAALVEARSWGATHVVAKGDLTHGSKPGQFGAVGGLLATSGMTADVILGNHDVRHRFDGPELLRTYGIDARPVTRVTDLAGLRVILVHTPGPGDRWGQVTGAESDRVARLAGAARADRRPCMLVVHHPPATGALTTHYPPGIYRHQSRRLLRGLANANPASFVVAGHTHRNRLRWAYGLPCVETGSTKDYPGGWTGYYVFEGGIVQTARRTAAPDTISWTERTGRALGGQWGRWTPGTLADRCWSHPWPE